MSLVMIPSIIIIIYCGLCPETIKKQRNQATVNALFRISSFLFFFFGARICGLIKCCISTLCSSWSCFYSAGRLSLVFKNSNQKENQRWHDFSHFVLQNKNMIFDFFLLIWNSSNQNSIDQLCLKVFFSLTFRSAHQLFIIFFSKFVWFSWISISVFALCDHSLPSRTNFWCVSLLLLLFMSV